MPKIQANRLYPLLDQKVLIPQNVPLDKILSNKKQVLQTHQKAKEHFESRTGQPDTELLQYSENIQKIYRASNILTTGEDPISEEQIDEETRIGYLKGLERELKKALSHLQNFSLTIEEGTRFWQDVNSFVNELKSLREFHVPKKEQQSVKSYYSLDEFVSNKSIRFRTTQEYIGFEHRSGNLRTRIKKAEEGNDSEIKFNARVEHFNRMTEQISKVIVRLPKLKEHAELESICSWVQSKTFYLMGFTSYTRQELLDLNTELIQAEAVYAGLDRDGCFFDLANLFRRNFKLIYFNNKDDSQSTYLGEDGRFFQYEGITMQVFKPDDELTHKEKVIIQDAADSLEESQIAIIEQFCSVPINEDIPVDCVEEMDLNLMDDLMDYLQLDKDILAVDLRQNRYFLEMINLLGLQINQRSKPKGISRISNDELESAIEIASLSKEQKDVLSDAFRGDLPECDIKALEQIAIQIGDIVSLPDLSVDDLIASLYSYAQSQT